jgi:hypothetical protein
LRDDPLPPVDELAALVERRAPASPADRLRLAIELGRELSDTGDALVERFVERARGAGLSWAEIGNLFGTSKQAAQKRYGATAATEPGARPGRWTRSAQHALDHAGEQARELGHNYVGTEHLLLGLLAARGGLAAQVLAGLGVSRAAVVGELPGRCEPRRYECLGVQRRLKQALEHARRVAERLGHQVAGSEHLLAGILTIRDSLPVEILDRRGISAETARNELARHLQVDPAQLVVTAGRRRRDRRRILARTR